jgi:hypothetical protein
MGHHAVGQQRWGGKATFLQPGRQRRDDRRQIAAVLPYILAAHEPEPDETGRSVIELLADFLADSDPVFRAGLHRFRIQNNLPHRQMFRKAGAARSALCRSFYLRRVRGSCIIRPARNGGNLLQPLKQKLHLSRIQLLTAAPEQPPGQHIKLLFEQFDFQMGKPQLIG